MRTICISLLTVRCLPLTDPNDGMIDCPPGDDGISSYEDTCRFTCNTGYELNGSDTRTCQSNRSWSGSDGVCRRGMYYVAAYITFTPKSKPWLCYIIYVADPLVY